MGKIINIIGSPGSGKSTLAAALFADLKSRRVSVELVDEYAKEIVYTNPDILKVQPKIFGEQLWKIERVKPHYDYIITDSPLILSVIYNEHYPASFNMAIVSIFKSYDNINFFLQNHRTNYDTTGRIQSLKESLKIEKDLLDLLQRCDIEYTVIRNDWKLKKMIRFILNNLPAPI